MSGDNRPYKPRIIPVYENNVRPNLPEIREMVGQGMNIDAICGKLQISRNQWNSYYEKFHEFKKTVDLGYEAQIERVEAAMFKRATGITYVEMELKSTTNTDAEGNSFATATKVVRTKQALPDVSAGKFILTNRRPEKWKEVMRTSVEGELDIEIKLPKPPALPVNNLLEEGEPD